MAETRIDELRRRLEREPASRLFAQLAEELRKEGALEEAIRVARGGLVHHPGYASARITLGRALLDAGEPGGARGELQAVLRIAPDNLLASRLLGEAHEALGDLGSALLQYRATLAMAEGDRALEAHVRALEERLKPAAPRPAPASSPEPGPPPATPVAAPPPPRIAVEGQVRTAPAPGPPSGRAVPPVPPTQPAPPVAVPLTSPPDRAAEPAQPLIPPGSGGAGTTARFAPPPGPVGRTLPTAATETTLPASQPAHPAPAPEDARGVVRMPRRGPEGTPAGASPEVRSVRSEGPVHEPAGEALPPLLDWGRPASRGDVAEAPTRPRARLLDLLFEEDGGAAPAPVEPLRPRDDTAADVGSPFSSPTLAELYFQQGLVDRAIEVYRQLLEQEPDNDRLRMRLADIMALAGPTAGAEPAPPPPGTQDDGRRTRRVAIERTIARLEQALAVVQRR